jgi:hypothetical protein
MLALYLFTVLVGGALLGVSLRRSRRYRTRNA